MPCNDSPFLSLSLMQVTAARFPREERVWVQTAFVGPARDSGPIWSVLVVRFWSQACSLRAVACPAWEIRGGKLVMAWGGSVSANDGVCCGILVNQGFAKLLPMLFR